MNAKLLFKFILMGLMLSALVLAGCDDGDDGRDGADGKSAYEIAVDNGFDGTEQEWLDSLQGDTATTAEPEQCAVCHKNVEAIHAATGVPEIVAANGVLDGITGDYTITVNLEVDGVATNEGYQLYRVYKTFDDPTNPEYTDPAATTTNNRVALLSLRNRNASDCTDSASCTIDNDLGDFGSTADGTFTLTVPVDEVVNNAVYTVIVRSLDSEDTYGWGRYEPGALVKLGTAPLRDLVTDVYDSENPENTSGCAACHGASASQLFDHYLVKGNECQACHTRYTANADFFSQNADGTWANQGSVPGGNFTEYIHGIHNSHKMPGDGTYVRSIEDDPAEPNFGEPTSSFSIGYPSDMRNCEICHASAGQLDAAVTAPVSFYLCMTCHQDWDGFVHGHDADDDSYKAGDLIMTGLLGSLHRPLGINDSCLGASCHSVPSRNEAGDFHNDFQGHDSHYDSYYRGKNVSFENETDVDFKVDSVDVGAGGALTVTWSATEGGVAVNPCNEDVTAGPTFQDLSGYLAYAKGDDWVNEFVGSAPGQPSGRTSFFPADTINTTCAANVATTTGLTLNPEALEYASKVVLAIGGKAQTEYAATGDLIYLRVESPLFEFNPADGTELAEYRRDAVNNEKCLGCHQGTLYQHGGDRVDNEQLCVICHNPSANDKNNRLDRFQIVNADGTVNTDVTYDSKNAETYDLRTMLHAIHGVEARLYTGGKPWVVYRGRGIYGFALDDTPLPAGWPAENPDDPNSEPIYGSINGSTINHTWTVVHYPKPVSDCEACHDKGKYEAADQTKAVGVTVDAGFDWPDQSDDTIIGPSAAACTACHAGAAQRSHAQSNGYKANVTKDEMLEKAN